MREIIYLDNASTTMPSSAALDAFKEAPWYNASSSHMGGWSAHKALDAAREKISKNVGCDPDEVFFTSGATESCVWAMKLLSDAVRAEQGVLCIGKGEHHAVSEQVNRETRTLTLPLNSMGYATIPTENWKSKLILFPAVMLANNETGVITNIPDLREKLSQKNPVPLMFTDATAAVGHIPVFFRELNVDYMAFAAHKFGGLKGVGALIIRKGAPGYAMIPGGGQEHGRRGGTESLPLISAMAAALEERTEHIEQDMCYVAALRDRLIENILNTIPGTYLNGTWTSRLPGTANITFDGISGASLVGMLSEHGIYAGTGAACASGDGKPSEVLTAMGINREQALGAVRFSLDIGNTEEEIDRTLKILPEIVRQLRSAR